jgi:hypothetical protein
MRHGLGTPKHPEAVAHPAKRIPHYRIPRY